MAETLDFTNVQGITTVFLTMYRNKKSSKSSPKNFLTPIFARKYKGFRNFHKDALGREKKLHFGYKKYTNKSLCR